MIKSFHQPGMQAVLLVDFSNLVYSQFFASLNGRKPETLPPFFDDHIGYLEAKLHTLREEIDLPENVETWYALDNFPKKKFEIFAAYKQNREEKTFDPRPAAINWLTSQQCRCFESSGFEADDVIATLIATMPNRAFTLVTSDKDLWRLLEHENCRVYNPLAMSFVEKSHLSESFKLENFRSITLYKSLWGDSGDNVPNLIPRMKSALIPLIEQSSGLEDFWATVEAKRSELSPRCVELLEGNREAVARNFELVKLSTDLHLRETAINLDSRVLS